MLRTLTAVTIIALCAHVAFADTHYVSKTGLNTYPFDTWATAADTVARAVESAGERDTILIAPGHYVTDTIVMKRGQVIMGAAMDSTFLDTLPSTPLRAIVASDSCQISDVCLRGDFVATALASGVAANKVFATGTGVLIDSHASVLLKRVRFENIGLCIKSILAWVSDSVYACSVDSCEFDTFEEAVSGFSSGVRLSNSTFHWNRSAITAAVFSDFGSLEVVNCRFLGYDPLTIENGTKAIRTLQTDPITIRNNLFHSTMIGRALELNLDGLTDSVGVGIIENNTFFRCYGHLSLERPGFIFRNNLSVWSTTSGVILGVENAQCTYNITWDNSPWDSGYVRLGDTIPNDIAGNIANLNADPMFADTLDFLLQAFSPAIDAGDPSILDADGSRSDIGYRGGPSGITYVYQDLPPAVPHGLTATPTDSEITLLWRFNHEADFSHYDLYRDTLPIVSPAPALLLATSRDSTYTDTSITVGQTYYYRLNATDKQNHTSPLSNERSILAAGISDHDPITPDAFMLYPNYPNPFNASTSIRYTLNRPAYVQLSIYSLLGRRIITLVNEPRQAGTHTVTWHAPHQPSGVYFIVLRSNNARATHKALLLK